MNKFLEKLKKIFTAIGIFFTAAVAVLIGVKVIQGIKAAKGKVEAEWGFSPGKKPDQIILQRSGKTYEVTLPEGITNDQVDRAGLGTGGNITVQVKHEKIDISNLEEADENSNLDI